MRGVTGDAMGVMAGEGDGEGWGVMAADWPSIWSRVGEEVCAFLSISSYPPGSLISSKHPKPLNPSSPRSAATLAGGAGGAGDDVIGEAEKGVGEELGAGSVGESERFWRMTL